MVPPPYKLSFLPLPHTHTHKCNPKFTLHPNHQASNKGDLLYHLSVYVYRISWDYESASNLTVISNSSNPTASWGCFNSFILPYKRVFVTLFPLPVSSFIRSLITSTIRVHHHHHEIAVTSIAMHICPWFNEKKPTLHFNCLNSNDTLEKGSTWWNEWVCVYSLVYTCMHISVWNIHW